MTTTSSSRGRAPRLASVLVGLILFGAVVSACSSSPKAASTTTTSASGATATTATSAGSSGSSSSLRKIEALETTVQGSAKETFKAVYTVVPTTGMTQTVTVEQAPPKSAITVGTTGLVIDTGTATYYCQTAENMCLNAGTSNPLASLTALFSPQTALNDFKAVQAEAAAHAAGYSISFSSGSYAGQSTTCANVTGGSSGPVKYCVTKQGLLAYASSAGATFSLTSYSTSPAASDFALPAGATVDTLPAGVTIPS
jgi:hypothetical protein